MKEVDCEGFSVDYRSSMFWVISIGVVGLLSYMFMFDFANVSFFNSLLDVFVGAERWASGSIYPNELEVVWLYIYLSYPIVFLKVFLSLNFSVKFIKNIPIFKEGGVFKIFLNFFTVFLIVYVCIRMFFYCELPLFGLIFDGDIASGSFRNSVYGNTYIYPLIISGFAALSALIASLMFFSSIYYLVLRVVKRREF